MYLQLHAPFLAAIQLIVYAGAVVVLFLFVIMLVHQRTVLTTTAFQNQWDLALLLLPVFLLPFLYVLWTDKLPDVPGNPAAFRAVGTRSLGNTQAIAWVLYRDYLLPFEVASVFLLVAMIGAVVLGKRSVEKVD
jgi:NADH-quinone oxidoreductase subunit J